MAVAELIVVEVAGAVTPPQEPAQLDARPAAAAAAMTLVVEVPTADGQRHGHQKQEYEPGQHAR